MQSADEKDLRIKQLEMKTRNAEKISRLEHNVEVLTQAVFACD